MLGDNIYSPGAIIIVTNAAYAAESVFTQTPNINKNPNIANVHHHASSIPVHVTIESPIGEYDPTARSQIDKFPVNNALPNILLVYCPVDAFVSTEQFVQIGSKING